MNDKRYIISDASKIIDVESHVLRYWEDELGIEIPRNEMGHRYYTDTYINLFCRIKDLKEKGFQLKAIKMILPSLIEGNSPSITGMAKPDSYGGAKLQMFRELLGNAISTAITDNNDKIISAIEKSSKEASDGVIKEMDYLLRMKEEEDEGRFRKFDEIMRNYQLSCRETAAVNTKEKKSWLKKGKK